jgi:hypothetical protein
VTAGKHTPPITVYREGRFWWVAGGMDSPVCCGLRLGQAMVFARHRRSYSPQRRIVVEWPTGERWTVKPPFDAPHRL